MVTPPKYQNHKCEPPHVTSCGANWIQGFARTEPHPQPLSSLLFPTTQCQGQRCWLWHAILPITCLCTPTYGDTLDTSWTRIGRNLHCFLQEMVAYACKELFQVALVCYLQAHFHFRTSHKPPKSQGQACNFTSSGQLNISVESDWQL